MKMKNSIYLIFFISCSLITLLFVIGMFFNTIKVNPIKLKMDLDNKVFTFVPQGWAFFTRDPREAQITIYKKNDKDQFVEINQRHSSVRNMFGLNRRASKIMSELQFIKKQINDTLFINTKWNYQENIQGKIPNSIIPVKNKIKHPILCGEYVVAFQKAVPWAWSQNIEQIKMPCKVIRIKIQCQ